ncbi:uncharacterized protein, PEP-CTERM system associated [Colwellia chukchiensis]|uniref:Uncharacterized protein, PEP-CTERM system associated n=1 Tax=Colwellia chukchiensis TaxID=641665 RepID=A0A1H7SC96_9GAMM|nr:TIGR03016 family PEP-CTERM system-associated outer membrane protein [Colwellia chukchiensis]SEL70272.1 uncharacterized protein, PEP-CTERM system associated [Colwellia chukchiensis]
MVTMAMGMAQKTRLSAIICTLFCSSTVFAGSWQFEPSIVINETYSDNARLTQNNEKSTVVSQTSLKLKSSYEAQHAVFNFSSESTYALYSHNHDLDKDFHTLASDLRLQLWPNGIILVGGASVSNQPRNSGNNALADIITADTVEVINYNAGLEYNINNSAYIINSGVGFRKRTSEDNLGERHGIVAQISSSNGTSARHVFWQFEHNYQELKNNEQNGKLSESEVKLGFITGFNLNPFLRYYNEDNSGDVRQPNRSFESNSYGIGLRWLVTPRLFIDASYNKPIGSKLNLDGEEQQEYVNAAINWQPTIRTKLTANFSERFYGDSYGLDLSHKNRRLTNSISYKEEVQTLTRNNFVANLLGLYFCPTGNVDSLDECLIADDSTLFPDNPNQPDNPGLQLVAIQDFTLVEDNVFSLNKVLAWRSVLALPRTTISFAADKQTRDNLETRIESQTQKASLNISRKISGRSNVSFNVSYTESNFQIDTEFERLDRYRRYQLGYDKSLNSALSFDISVSYLNRHSSNVLFNYQESRISAKITKGF